VDRRRRCTTCSAARRPFLSAKRLLTNQIFRDIYRTDTLDVDQRLKITSLTFLFTDLKGSTALYERVGDLAAYDLVRQHFHVCTRSWRRGGAVVKTIGDAVMATFRRPTGRWRRRCACARRCAHQRRAAERGPAAEDRHSRRAVPRGRAQR
jgi:class 3 adenylate cyclase